MKLGEGDTTRPVAPVADRLALGVGLMLAAYLCFTGIDASARWLARETGLPPMQVAFIRYVGHLVIVLAVFAPGHGAAMWRTSNLRWEVWRGLFLLGSTLLNFTAVKYLPLSMTGSIMFASPLFVCAFSTVILGERVGVKRWTAIGVGFLGVLMVLRPWSAELHWAMILSLSASVCVALYVIATRRLAGADSTVTQQFYAAAVATLGTAAPALLVWRWPEQTEGWIAFFTVGFFGWLGHQLLTTAHRFAPASALAPFVYVQLIYLSVADLIVFGVSPDPAILPGAAVVVSAGLFIWLRERILRRPPSGQPTPMR